MMDVTQPQEQPHDDGVGAANVISERQFVDISTDVGDQFRVGESSSAVQPLIPVHEDNYPLDAVAFGSDSFQPYASPYRVRLLHFRVEYRQKNVQLILQDINCVG